MTHWVWILVLAIAYVVQGRSLWHSRGWLPRTLYVVGGVLVAWGFVDSRAGSAALGAVAIVLARIVPAHGWHRQPGEG